MRCPSAEEAHSHSSLEFNSYSVKQEDACSHFELNASQISGLDKATARRRDDIPSFQITQQGYCFTLSMACHHLHIMS